MINGTGRPTTRTACAGTHKRRRTSFEGQPEAGRRRPEPFVGKAFNQISSLYGSENATYSAKVYVAQSGDTSSRLPRTVVRAVILRSVYEFRPDGIRVGQCSSSSKGPGARASRGASAGNFVDPRGRAVDIGPPGDAAFPLVTGARLPTRTTDGPLPPAVERGLLSVSQTIF